MDRSGLCTCLAAVLLSAAASMAAEGPSPALKKSDPLTLAELAGRSPAGVSAAEVSDYAPGRYRGELSPSPPHADMNPGKAVIISWEGSECRFVFSHEASYCPILELPNGAGMCSQFFEGNIEGVPENHQGSAELFNINGRKERNSFVDVIESGPGRVWVRWNYFAVNKLDDTRPRLRGTEDYFAYPNGLILRRLTYESLMPEEYYAYSQQPVELFGVAPAGSVIGDLFPKDPAHGDYLTLAAMDVYGGRRYEVYWGAAGAVRRSGDDAMMTAIAESPGRALVMPFNEKKLFAIFGDASGFPSERSDLVDHCTPGVKSGCEWGQGIWDHWPIGWLNSQASFWKPGSPYAYSFGSIGQFFIPPGRRYSAFVRDYFGNARDMELNRWTEGRVFYVLLGAADTWDEIRSIGRRWLELGPDCARPEGLRGLTD